jgi:anhydro-N-acetylmuramic acid kinase
VNATGDSAENLLRTFCEHIAIQIAREVNINSGKKENQVLITGGGAHNKFLISLIQSKINTAEVILPAKEIIDFKEALVFAFLGLLRKLGKNNVLGSVTGAPEDHCSGLLIHSA